MAVPTITSAQNPRVKAAVKLRDSRQRARQARFVIDGARELQQALWGRIELDELFVCVPLCRSDEARGVLERLDQIEAEVWHVVPEVFEKLAFGKRHDGLVAVAKVPERSLAQLKPAGGGLVAVLEGVEKPGNVGAVLRTADAAGVAAVLLADPRTDLFNPNCIRASLGTVFTLPVARCTSAEALDWLHERKLRIFAARPDARRLYTDADLGSGAAVALGSEAQGLSELWKAGDVVPIKLPMRGTADSLNVSAASAVLFYEALRQREQQQGG
jgi:TrmH family RNA methyltransferase